MAASKYPLLRLRHIKDELDWMLPKAQAMDFADFAADIVMIRAVERALLIISEAAKALPDDLIDHYPDVEWHAVRAIGNIIRHEYDRVENRILWRTLTRSLPVMATVIDQMIRDLSAHS